MSLGEKAAQGHSSPMSPDPASTDPQSSRHKSNSTVPSLWDSYKPAMGVTHCQMSALAAYTLRKGPSSIPCLQGRVTQAWQLE